MMAEGVQKSEVEEELEPSVLHKLSTIRERYGQVQQKYKEWKFNGKWLRY